MCARDTYPKCSVYPYSVAQHSVALARSFRLRWQALLGQFDAQLVPDDMCAGLLPGQ